MRISKKRIARIKAAIAEFVPTWSLGPVVRALQTLRGVDLIVADVSGHLILPDCGHLKFPGRCPGPRRWDARDMTGILDRVR